MIYFTGKGDYTAEATHTHLYTANLFRDSVFALRMDERICLQLELEHVLSWLFNGFNGTI